MSLSSNWLLADGDECDNCWPDPQFLKAEIAVDLEAGSIYIGLIKGTIKRTYTLGDAMRADLDDRDQVIGIEINDARLASLLKRHKNATNT